MARDPRGTHQDSSRLFSTPEDWLSALPGEELRDDTWVEKVVDLETWLYDDEYLGLTIRLSEIQLEALRRMDPIDDDCRFTEIVLEWGKGSGKDFICSLAGLRQCYQLLCLRDVYDYFGLAKNTGIQLVNVAYTQSQAKNVFFKQLKGILKTSPWFMRQNPVVTRDRIKFNHEIEFVSAAADGDSLEGQNLFFALMDEASAFKEAKVVKAVARAEGVKPEKAADLIYNVLRTSTRSRFPRVGKVVMISYPRYRDDFIQTKRKEAEMSDNAWSSGPYCTWEVNPRVEEEALKATDDYRLRPEMARAMYECKPPYAEDPYIAYPERFIYCIANTVHVMPELVCPIDDNGAYDEHFQGLPGRWYSIHVDLAVRKDRCALALARQGQPVTREKCPCNKWNFPTVEACSRCGRPKERWVKVELPTMVVTLLKEFAPRVNQSGVREVDFSDVREEILWIQDRGHKIWALSFDGWQSQDTIQIMSKTLGRRKVRNRYDPPDKFREEEVVQLLSVDRNTEAHDTLREFIYDKRFFLYPPPGVETEDQWSASEHPVALAFQEWRKLRLINGKKVDHPLGGSKDFVDSLAGAAYHVARMPIPRNYSGVVKGWSEAPPDKRALSRTSQPLTFSR